MWEKGREEESQEENKEEKKEKRKDENEVKIEEQCLIIGKHLRFFDLFFFFPLFRLIFYFFSERKRTKSEN